MLEEEWMSKWVLKVWQWHLAQWIDSRFQIRLEIVLHCRFLHVVGLRLRSVGPTWAKTRFEDFYGPRDYLLYYRSANSIGYPSVNPRRSNPRQTNCNFNELVPTELLRFWVRCTTQDGVFLYFQCCECLFPLSYSEWVQNSDFQSEPDLKKVTQNYNVDAGGL